ncbi:MFS transporter [Paenibacillus sp. CCS19]|uniref:MFS transporter n=1 Tax=Paenibacillus sp. CCS19 TaxID=3158387 RepID=UPI00256AB732|nr:MFS transporter [Paenibacillus cellulosilyticus]GMK41465.1 MFS transporter [Paenibacillus cellulosilyticus]
MSVTTNQSSTYRAVLRNSSFMKLLSGQTVSQLGDALSFVIIPLLIYEMTHSSTNLVLGFVIESLPWIVLGPLAGVFIDRLNKRMLLVSIDLIRCFLIAGIFFTDKVWAIYLLIFLSHSLAAVFAPVRSLVIPLLCERSQYVKSIGLLVSSFKIANISGSFVAALVISAVGSLRTALWIDAATFFVSFLLSASIRMPAEQPKDHTTAKPVFREQFMQGARYLSSHTKLKFVASSFLLDTFVLAGVAVGALLYTKSSLGLTESGQSGMYASLIGAMAAGTAIGAWLIGLLEKRIRRQTFILISLVMQSIIFAIIGWSSNAAAAVALFFFLGLFASGTKSPISGYMAEMTPADLRGRIYSIINSLQRVAAITSYAIIGYIGGLGHASVAFLLVSFLILACTGPIVWGLRDRTTSPATEAKAM